MTDTVHLYVFDGYADWEPAFAIAAIHQPQFQREPGRWRVETVGATTARVRSMGGVAAVPDAGFDRFDPRRTRLLILPGGLGWEQPPAGSGDGEAAAVDGGQAAASDGGRDDPHAAAIAAARSCIEAGVPVAAICGATAGLARAGLLDEREHTSNAAGYLKGTGYAGGAHYRDAAAVTSQDRLVVTAGGMAPVDFAREVFSLLALYEEEALDAWFQLYKTGKSEYYARLARAA